MNESSHRLLVLALEQAALTAGPTTVVEDTLDMIYFIDDLADAVVRETLTAQEAVDVLNQWQELNVV